MVRSDGGDFYITVSQNGVSSYVSRRNSTKFDYKSQFERGKLTVVFLILNTITAKWPISDRTTGVYSVNYIMFRKSCVIEKLDGCEDVYR